MDANKRAALEAIDYVILDTCDSCDHARFAGCAEFGTCDLYEYQHEKHTGHRRQLSIHRAGICARYARRTGAQADAERHRLGDFIGFRERL